ncbi:DUF2922 domain-containing protein [Clostridium septicum]|uniref:DUF2922 domain-containing protein n=1 Tax=Clostridium septicum TaxID=1504 RepID=A0A9N7JJT4_CLOSE|nr:DUF2922 domain-containing protein [Clostridium septicum]AYE33898.1 DUF2922 domain-containing protein [Clostridium septicum]MDU1312952.1 DUF2922 domain-containing protein [Clostridium septicum]QAS62049.1 DUF2922 domain-containing protein [Clostridium septicum]UEC21495.1 DUF2922 domain-containing protein [Clostridium septicum]USS00458.1 DUF2922 domain-containing protein [Clostridium septicum]
MATTVVMGFKDPVDRTVRLSVRDVKSDVNDTEINALMDKIIETKTIETEAGALASKVKAEIVVREVTEVSMS